MGLFMARLGIAETTYYESFRPWLPVVYVSAVPIEGQAGRFRPGTPRVREDVARELVEIAAAGGWESYREGALAETRPHLYATPERTGTP